MGDDGSHDSASDGGCTSETGGEPCSPCPVGHRETGCGADSDPARRRSRHLEVSATTRGSTGGEDGPCPGALPTAPGHVEHSPTQEQWVVKAHNFSAMGTTIEAWTEIDDAPVSLIDLFELVEDVCSRFRPESELTQINLSDDPQVTPSPLMAELLDGAERARTITQGLVDVGVGRSVRAWGYDRTFSEITDLDREPSPMTPGRWRFEDGVLTRHGEVELDLGGLAKGWTCDRAVETGLAPVVAAGGDLRSNHPGTRVSVAGPGGVVDVVVELGVGALATSSTTRRAWRAGGRKVSHIVDPRSMRPVETPITSATVIADKAADAEAGAKAIVILGIDGLAWATAQPWIRGAMAFWEDGSLFATPGLELAA